MTSGQELCGHGVCVQTSDVLGYRCICDQGWTNNNRTPECTIDIDECSSTKPHCSMDPEVMCVNLPGSYACGRCPPGKMQIIFLVHFWCVYVNINPFKL